MNPTHTCRDIRKLSHTNVNDKSFDYRSKDIFQFLDISFSSFINSQLHFLLCLPTISIIYKQFSRSITFLLCCILFFLFFLSSFLVCYIYGKRRLYSILLLHAFSHCKVLSSFTFWPTNCAVISN